jgi:hypothetical protein
MKKLLESKWKLHNLLTQPVVVGDILHVANLLEFDLNLALIDFFAPPDRRDTFEELVLSELRFHQKIEIFRRLPINKALKSYRLALTSVTRIKKVRNFVAHGFSIREKELEKMAKDKEFMAMFDDYPKSLHRELKLARLRLTALSRSRSYAKSSIPATDISTIEA